MNRASGAATNPSQIVCRCGGDHRGTENRHCPVFNVLDGLNTKIREFLGYQKVLEFGKNGPMAHCLRSIVLEEYDSMIKIFQEKEATSQKHPEWHLADEIARSRSYFEQVTDGYAEAKKTLGPRPPASVIPSTIGDEKTTLGWARYSVEHFYDTCVDVISEFVLCGADLYMGAHERYLTQVDNGFKETFENIIQLPRTENATIQDLTQKLYDIWKENRRLLCDFKG